MSEPTREQALKLWLWCGWKAVKHKDCYAPQTTHGKTHPDGICHYEYGEDKGTHPSLPDLDLNNLFKWAVPKLGKTSLYTHFKLLGYPEATMIPSGLWEAIIWERPNIEARQYITQHEDPALALFWAIHSLIDKSPLP